MKKLKLVKEKGYFQSLRETKSVKELENGVEISWYASTKDKDRWGDIVEPKAFQSALERYMTNPIVLLQHKADKPIWIVEQAEIDDNWLYIKAKITQNTDWVVDLIKDGVLRAFSIWYSVKEYDTDVKELADWSYDMTNIIKDLELYEISVVSIPMNPYALSKSIEDMFEVEEKEEEVETSIDTVAENENKEEEVIEWENDKEEEVEKENTEIESQENWEKEEEKEEFENIFDDEQKEWEIEEEKVVENNEEKIADDDDTTDKADENSEISEEEEVEESSENVSETETDDEQVVETHDEGVIETKSMETKSQNELNFKSELESFSKSFDEKLALKDKEIENLKSKVESMSKLFVESLETIDRLTTAVKNTPVASGLAYKRPLRKWGYGDVAEALKNL